MQLAKMNIKNYRQFEDVTILYDDNVTILAGANNSGKTSLVELYKNIFNKTEKRFSIEDMPVLKAYKSTNALADKMISIYESKQEKEFFLDEISKLFLKDDYTITENKEYYIDGINVDIEVVYQEYEKITRFSDYLMELDSNNKSFYFRYAVELNINKLQNLIKENFTKIESRISLNKEGKEDKKKNLSDFLIKQYDLCLEEQCYYCNHSYTINLPMKLADFKKLFNCNFISATREVNDLKEDEHYSVSREMLSILGSDENWETLIEMLPEQISTLITDAKITNKIEIGSMDGLKKTLEEISKNTDGNVGELSLNVDVNNEDIMAFLIKAIEARYRYDQIYLKEASQGLGFSNWIFIYLRLEKFCKTIEEDIVNFFIIEEPEAHMHPQMQRALVKHLNASYCENKIQGIITTHSHELVRASELEKIRVIRQVSPFTNKIYDMNNFKLKLDEGEERDFFSLLFSINYSDLIFSSKVIMYEGDTEKLFIESLLKHAEFEKLADQYISYVQVGGAYAHNYKKLINFLSIKTLIITDIDYDKELIYEKDILESTITNAAIKEFYHDNKCLEKIEDLIAITCTDCDNECEQCFKNLPGQEQLDNLPNNEICRQIKPHLDVEIKKILKLKQTVSNLYGWIQSEDGLALIQFQKKDDEYTRTLEEAMLCKYLKMKLSDKKTRNEWKLIKKDEKLKFSIPNKTDDEKVSKVEKELGIRDIVQATGKGKTDFMYSVILSKREMDMLPCYLKEGLQWLAI